MRQRSSSRLGAKRMRIVGLVRVRAFRCSGSSTLRDTRQLGSGPIADPLAAAREVVLFDNTGIGRSSGTVPPSVARMPAHALAFLNGMGLEPPTCSDSHWAECWRSKWWFTGHKFFRRMIVVGTAPRAARTSRTSTNRLWRDTPTIRTSEAAQYCRKSSLRPKRQASPPGNIH
jgi:hypothetical protein